MQLNEIYIFFAKCTILTGTQFDYRFSICSIQVITVLFVETPRKFISTDEDPGLRIESFAVINLRGVSTNKTIIYFIAMQTYKELIQVVLCNTVVKTKDKFHWAD